MSPRRLTRESHLLGLRGRRFPFVLSGEARICPSCERVCLVVADVRHGVAEPDGLTTVHGERGPPVFLLLPVEGGTPPFFLHEIPTGAQPQLGAGIPTVVHEVEVLAVGDEALRNRERSEKNVVSRAFVVEVKPVALEPDGDDTALVLCPP